MRAGSLRQERGFGFVVVILMLGVVSMVAASISLRTQRSLQISAEQTKHQAADDVAYSGLQVGLAHVATAGNDWNGMDASVEMPHRAGLAYRLLVNSNFTQTTSIVDSDGTEIPGESVYLKSLAYRDQKLFGGMAAVVAQQRGMSFNYPAFGSDSVKVEDSVVQAVAGQGSPDANEWIPVDGEAHIRTNSTLDAAISLLNGSYVDGDVIVGQGGDPLVALQAEGGSGFSGTADIAGVDLPLPDVPASYDPTAPDAPPGMAIPLPIPIPGYHTLFLSPFSFQVLSPGSYDEVVLDSGEAFEPNITGVDPLVNYVLLPPGDYYINKLSCGDGVLNVIITEGEVRLHVKETVDLNNVYSQSEAASHLQIYQTEAGGSANLSQVYGSFVLASQGPVELLESELNGALYGSSVSIKGSKLAYPQALDGVALNDKIKGDWTLYGMRKLRPSELSVLASLLGD